MAFTTTTGLFVFHLARDKPLGTGVLLNQSQSAHEDMCCREGCTQTAGQVLDLPVSACSPFGFNTAFIYEDDDRRDRIQLNVCENCGKDPKDGFIYLIHDEDRFSTLRRCTFTKLK